MNLFGKEINLSSQDNVLSVKGKRKNKGINLSPQEIYSKILSISYELNLFLNNFVEN